MSTHARKDTMDIEQLEARGYSEAQFRALLEKSRDAVALFGEDTKVLYISPAVEYILGYTPDEYKRLEHGFDLLHPDDKEHSLALVRALLATAEERVIMQHRVRHKQGTYRWIEVTMTNLLTDPDVHAIVATFRDITERKQDEERQQLLDEASKLLVSSLDHQITLQEIAQMIVPKLADYCRIGILDEEHHIKDITVNHIHPEQLALVRALYEQYRDRTNATHGLQRLFETGKPELISDVSGDVLPSMQDNPELLTIIQALGLKSYMGTPLIVHDRIIGAITFSSTQPHRHYTPDDLTFAQELARRIALVLENARLHREAQEEIAERKRVEAQLRQSEERYRLVVEHTMDLITLLDIQGTIIYNSPSCQTLLGYTPQEMIGEPALSFVHPDDRARLEVELTNVVRGGSANVASYRARHKDGHWVILAATGSAVYDEQGHPFLIVSTSHDITQQQELERRKDEFISMASHELKTPVTSLRGFTHILQRRFAQSEDAQVLHYLARMDVQLKKLTKLISDLLDLSRIQTGKLTFEEERFDLDRLVRETVENLQAVTPTHQLAIESIGSIFLYGDRDRIEQVLLNLLTNAIKYSPDASKVLIRVASDQHRATVSVQDFGIGIANGHHQKIFERFYQAEDATEQTYPGLGIGLYISQEIVQRHHGRIWVESQKGGGATFYMSLPLVQEG
jgi:PAS domain S-box-containing protein